MNGNHFTAHVLLYLNVYLILTVYVQQYGNVLFVMRRIQYYKCFYMYFQYIFILNKKLSSFFSLVSIYIILNILLNIKRNRIIRRKKSTNNNSFYLSSVRRYIKMVLRGLFIGKK